MLFSGTPPSSSCRNLGQNRTLCAWPDANRCVFLFFKWTDAFQGNASSADLCYEHVFLLIHSLLLSVWCVTRLKAALGGLCSPCVPMWSDREGDRAVDVTLGYDLNTCLRRSSDQSSLCQAPLPAGNFSMRANPPPSLNRSPFCFSLPLFVFFFFSLLLILSPSPGRSPNLPSLRSVSRGPPAPRVTHFTLPRRASPALRPPFCARVDSPGPLASF